MNTRAYLWCLAAIFLAGIAMRVAWLRADPPVVEPVGIIWHDEGAWTHNARNRVIEGTWRTDAWNPVFVSPVFTALEYASFSSFGVGLWQARVVPVVSGLTAIVFMAIGLNAAAGRRAAVMGAALLATNYGFVMWNRAALLESTMTACLVSAWAALALADRRPRWAFLAGLLAIAAWFTKAAAAFFLAALLLDACLSLGRAFASDDRRASMLLLAGLVAGAVAVSLAFVAPHLTEYVFYNWQMSVTRKPAYTIGALVDRATWLPVVQSLFSRMWPVIALGCLALVSVLSRARRAGRAERLLVWWILIGLAELVVHDSGNERRYVMFIPPFIALASLWADDAREIVTREFVTTGVVARLIGAALVAVGVYLTAGSALRPIFLADVDAGILKLPVRIAAAAAIITAAVVLLRWSGVVGALRGRRLPRALVAGAAAAAIVWNVYLYGTWARRHDDVNYEASVALGSLLPAGTLVQGKLANGMALESRIRPLFVGNGFGNYADRLSRPDVRYILTYDLPRIGYESSDGSGLIDDILAHYPQRRTVATFEVDETPGPDRAALFDVSPPGSAEPDARD